MQPQTAEFKQDGQLTIETLKEELKAIRTGRASASLIEGIVVETYGGSAKMRLMEIATIMTEGPSVLVVAPFDPSTTPDIEKAILKSPLGISPTPQGGRLVIRIPPMSTEGREKMVKLVSQKIEEKRVIIRGHRDDIRKKIRASFDAKELTEDNKFRLEKDIDAMATELMGEIDEIKSKKEKEIMEV